MDMLTQEGVEMEIEYNLTGAVKDYGMFTELGNSAVHAVVIAAGEDRLTWPQTYRVLYQLSKQKEFGEATDTEVRECVYSALNFDTPFYF
jgi:hypothetical protein